MTTIDTYVAAKHWKDECKYLEAVELVALNSDGKITILADEEGNDEILLTPKAARWVAKRLVELANEVDKS